MKPKPTPPRNFVISNRVYRGFSLADVAPRVGSLEILSKPSRYQKRNAENEGKVLHDLPDTQK